MLPACFVMCMCMLHNLTIACTPLCSIWTIDLAHLLRRFGMEVVFCTITLGANPAFSSEAFYAENMPEDEARVQQLFNVSTCCEQLVVCWHAMHSSLRHHTSCVQQLFNVRAPLLRAC